VKRNALVRTRKKLTRLIAFGVSRENTEWVTRKADIRTDIGRLNRRETTPSSSGFPRFLMRS